LMNDENNAQALPGGQHNTGTTAGQERKKGMNEKHLFIAAIAIVFLFIGFVVLGSTNDGYVKTAPTAALVYGETGLLAANNKTGYEQTQATITQAIADGAYAKNLSYEIYGNSDTVEIRLGIKNDVIESASLEIISAGDKSKKYIGNFASALPDLVVGKKITELNLPVQVSGSSITTRAFKQYVEELIQK